MSNELKIQLAQSHKECARLRAENARLRAIIGIPDPEEQSAVTSEAGKPAISHTSSSEAKIQLFRRLFRGRVDIYAVRWERNEKKGYAPASKHRWPPDPKNREFLPMTDAVIESHLTGKQVVGAYPLLKEETCWFLAADFDKADWMLDVAAFLQTCREWKIPAALERSRSGKGGHVWFFFDRAISAALARKMGAAILTKTMERRHQLGLDSYDRFFPSQDTLPKGGFGNLIALPMQGVSRRDGNSVFLDESLEPYADQWAFLSSIQTIPIEDVAALVSEAERSGAIVGVRASSIEDEDDPWKLPPSGKKQNERITEPLPASVHVVRSNLLFVEKEGLPPAMLNRLIRLAAFQNPEFYKAQAMRLHTFGKPRVIQCAGEFPRHIALPRGCLSDLKSLLIAHKVSIKLEDERFAGRPLDVTFNGTLRGGQSHAVETLLAHDDGILSATTAFGKTVVAAWMIAKRQTNTLVLVHRRQLLDQWRERLAAFLNLPVSSVGHIGGGARKQNGQLDVAVIQSLNRKGVVQDLVADYGQVIVDECHHLSAFSFEQVMRQVKARYVLGLTATPVRKDGHHPIILMQCGPIRFRVSAKEQAASRPFQHIVIPKHTAFRIPETGERAEIHTIYAALVADELRNQSIISDLFAAIAEGRSPLMLTERLTHAQWLADQLQGRQIHVVVLKGGMTKKQRQASENELAAIPPDAPRVLISTGRYIGEGFDDSRLDTLFLTLPISWKGTLQQYVGRLHRLHDGKKEVQVYDYVDDQVSVLANMYGKRLRGYEAMGYTIRKDDL